MEPRADVIGPARCAVGESPLWSPREQALYWVDIEGRRLHRWSATGGGHFEWSTEQRIGCVALHAEGGLVGALEDGLFHLRPGDRPGLSSERIASIAHPRPDMRFNDGRCDRAGRFWVGSMVNDTSLGVNAGALYRFDQRGLSPPLVQELITANGLGFSPDGRTMYLSDSHPSVRRIWAFDLGDDGVPRNRRLFVDMKLHPGRPDGAAVDADGCYWICANDAGQVHRFTPKGVLDRSLELPVSKPSMCAFGGANLDQLFVTSIVPARPVEGFDAALDGAVFMLQPGIQGLPETPFSP